MVCSSALLVMSHGEQYRIGLHAREINGKAVIWFALTQSTLFTGLTDGFLIRCSFDIFLNGLCKNSPDPLLKNSTFQH